MIVVDTNILVYFYAETPHLSSAARALFDIDPLWYAPYLWRSEFRNALTMRMRHEKMPLDRVLQTIQEAEEQMQGRERSISAIRVMRLVASST